MMLIRYAALPDLPTIVEIYNAAIPTYRSTADTSVLRVEDRRDWFAAHDPASRPLWVAEVDGRVAGWVSFQTYYGRPAYRPTAEVSVYVHPSHQRRGLGRALLHHALDEAPRLGIATVLAFVFAHNEPSWRLFEATGFQRWGHLPRIAHMPDGRRDVLILGLEILGPEVDQRAPEAPQRHESG